ncbi:hypothetical protein [Listeria booriae]|uniref:Uncharacterized protein n=1 Tax=Listeria booriae TaxID=1552123 RepID=A0A7X0XWJ4_9LIST|nr:hypothetical protein [Listeria booriae]MBC1793084.1 hypothetical protein [Listeria booriae]
MPIFITVIILIYFITKQFEYEKVNRLTYVAIPIYSIYQITVTLPHRSTDIPVWIVFLVFVIGACIGIYQASKVQIKDAKVTTGYTEVAGVEQVVYKKQIMVKGGARYLIGWAADYSGEIFTSVLASSRCSRKHDGSIRTRRAERYGVLPIIRCKRRPNCMDGLDANWNLKRCIHATINPEVTISQNRTFTPKA